MLKRALAMMLVAVMGIVLAGCNTVEGMGRDTEAVGQGIQDVVQ